MAKKTAKKPVSKKTGTTKKTAKPAKKTAKPAKKAAEKPDKALKRVSKIDGVKLFQSWGPRLTKTAEGKTVLCTLWRPHDHGITQGFMNTFLECRETARLKYLVGLRRGDFKSAIHFGLVFHDALAHVDMSRQEPDAALSDFFKKKESKLLKKHPDITPDERIELSFTDRVVQTLISRYSQYWVKEDRNKEWLAREEVFRVPCQSTFLTGRWDGVFIERDKNSTAGRLWIHETKTKGSVDGAGIQESLHLTLQPMMYLMAAVRHYRDQGMDVRPGGVLYDVIKRPTIKQTKKETVDQYINRLYEDIAERPEFYFFRWRVSISTTQLNNYAAYVVYPLVANIVQWYGGFWDSMGNPRLSPMNNPHHMFNPNALFTKWGRSDLFNLFVRGDTRDLSYGDVPFPELIDEPDEGDQQAA